MGSDDWYRNENWNQEIEEGFFKKLGKSRSQKTQYLKIQASYLIESHPDIVLRLADYARMNCPDEFWEQEFCLYESKALHKQGKHKEAVVKAYESVDWRIKKPGIQTEIPYWLSRIILQAELKDDYKKCLEILMQLHTDTPFPTIEFNFHCYSALLLSRTGEKEKAKKEALKALKWADMDKNLLQNERKRKYGIFKKKHEWPYDEVLVIAGK